MSQSAQTGSEDEGESLPLLLVCDIDDTLVGDDAALAALAEELRARPDVLLGTNSSRPIESYLRTLGEQAVTLKPVVMIGAMGTQVRIDGEPDAAWEKRFINWDRPAVWRAMTDAGFEPHPEEFQTPLKASFDVPAERRAEAAGVVASTGQRCHVLASGETDYDITPTGTGKGEATMYAAARLGVGAERVVVAGDSGNDLAMFEAGGRGIVVGNARPELRDAVDPASAYFARGRCAAGVLEGLRYWTRRLNAASQSVPDAPGSRTTLD